MAKDHGLIPAGDDYVDDPERTAWYQRAVGYIMFAAYQTRPDIAYAVSVLSRFSARPSDLHVAAAKRLMRYLSGTRYVGIVYCFKKDDRLKLKGHSDSDWAGDVGTRKSTSGFVIIAGGGPVSWKSALQTTVARSSTEAEYYGLGELTKEVLWVQMLLHELEYNGKDLRPFQIFEDNRGAIALSLNPEHHKRTKHIDVVHHFVRHHVAEGTIQID